MKQAANKIQIAKDIIANHYENGQRWIVYCEDKTQLDQVALAIQAAGVSNVIRYYADILATGSKPLNISTRLEVSLCLSSVWMRVLIFPQRHML